MRLRNYSKTSAQRLSMPRFQNDMYDTRQNNCIYSNIAVLQYCEHIQQDWMAVFRNNGVHKRYYMISSLSSDSKFSASRRGAE